MIYHILSLVLLSVIATIANAGQISSVELSAQAGSQITQLIDQKFEPIYEQQPYQATCNREVFDHTETTCHTVNDTVCQGSDAEVCRTVNDQVCNSNGCTTVPRRECTRGTRTCNIVPRRECHDRAIYRTEYFSCTKYQTVIVGQRLVKTFEHTVEVVVDRPELLLNERLVIGVSVNEDSLSGKLLNRFSHNLLTVETINLSASDEGAVLRLHKRILIHVESELTRLNQILMSSVQNLQLSSSGISLELPGLAELARELNIGINLSQRRPIIKDKTLFNGVIDSGSLSLVGSGDSLKVMIPLSKLGIERLVNKRHTVSVSVSIKRPNIAILNDVDVAAIMNKRLEASKVDVYP